MWDVVPVIGYKVILNPEGGQYHDYRHQSKDGAGWIVKNNLSNDELKNWIHLSQSTKLRNVVIVQWENGHKNSYQLADLLPIENDFRDVTTVLFDDGYEKRDFTEKIEEMIDYQVIVKGKEIVSRYDYDQAYRDQILNPNKSTEERVIEEFTKIYHLLNENESIE